ncbi:MAG: HAD family hydrolase [Lachnospiraceae bacterium]|nr:HAD family hydrolase [Lachnospiraceae bacterium]
MICPVEKGGEIIKTLYITDLDGTLLHHNERISPWSCNIINGLIEKGMLFSYATARSIHTASVVTEGLKPQLPVIVNNGSFLTDSSTQRRIHVNQFSSEEAQNIYASLQRHQIAPRVDAIINGHEKFSYDELAINPALAEFVAARKNDGRNNPLHDTSVILQGDVFYFTCIGEEEKLRAAYEELKSAYNCIFQFDIYSNEPWLEVMPHTASKSHAITQLKEMYNCDRVVVFGDGANDVPMFETADEGYAMANAIDALKEIATAIIDSNENDGVAKWLAENVRTSIR